MRLLVRVVRARLERPASLKLTQKPSKKWVGGIGGGKARVDDRKGGRGRGGEGRIGEGRGGAEGVRTKEKNIGRERGAEERRGRKEKGGGG